MKVLCGGPAREVESPMFRAHVEGLECQGGFTVGKGSSQSTVEVVVRHDVVADPGGPRWHLDKLERVAKARQVFLDACVAERVGYLPHPKALFMVDADVIVGPGVLERLWAVDADVVTAVYWTRDGWGQPEHSDVAPQVWWTHPYDWRPNDLAAMTCWGALCEPGVNEVQVNGGGACTLIRGRGFESHYWPLLESLKGAGRLWPGEDRTYCLGLECRGIRHVAVTGLPAVHLYDASLQTPAKVAQARELVGLSKVGA